MTSAAASAVAPAGVKVVELAAAMAAARETRQRLLCCTANHRRVDTGFRGSFDATMVLWLVPVLWAATAAIVVAQVAGAISWWASGLVVLALVLLTVSGQSVVWCDEVAFRFARRRHASAERRVELTHRAFWPTPVKTFDTAAATAASDSEWLRLMCELRHRFEPGRKRTALDVMFVAALTGVRCDPVAGVVPVSWAMLVTAEQGGESFADTVKFLELASAARVAASVVWVGPLAYSSIRHRNPEVVLEGWQMCARLEAAGVEAVTVAKVLLDRGGKWTLRDLVDTAVELTAQQPSLR